jgi:3-deoxy-D-manno-octulosonic-acid transferase
VQRALYSIALYLLAPVALLRLAWLGFRNRGYWQRWHERFGFIAERATDAPLVWIHAVSVGEAQAARPLVERLRDRRPGLQTLITTTTPTGASIVRETMGDRVEHRYFPYDLPGVVARYLRRLRPCLLVLMETEIWPNLIEACDRDGVRVLLANARMSEHSAAGYRLASRFTRDTLRRLSAVAAQNRADAERLIALGAPAERVFVTGSLKFDVPIPPSTIEQAQAVRRLLGRDRPVWIAASTHRGEDEQVLAALRRVLADEPDLLLALAPRHPERSASIADRCRAAGFACVSRSSGRRPDAQTRVYLIDTIGELTTFYGASDLVFVGGSLVPHGGHNVLEPAALGLPVLTGLHTDSFAEICAKLRQAGALRVVDDADALARAVGELIGDAAARAAMGEAGRAVVAANRGAVTAVAGIASALLEGAPDVSGSTPTAP